MNSDSDDEFGDGKSLEYNEAFEAQLRIIEGQAQRHLGHSSVSEPLGTTTDRAPAVRRKLDHLDVSLEDDVADDEAVDGLIGDEEQVLMDVLNIPASQSSKYEEDLVQQVTSLMPDTSQQVSPLPQDVSVSAGDRSLASTDGVTADEDNNQVTKRKKSLFQEFRRRGFFSVTDLVSPSWCEVQVRSCIGDFQNSSLLTTACNSLTSEALPDLANPE